MYVYVCVYVCVCVWAGNMIPTNVQQSIYKIAQDQGENRVDQTAIELPRVKPPVLDHTRLYCVHSVCIWSLWPQNS